MGSQVQIGKNLKKARKKAKLTQEQVADKAGIHVSYYSRIERGVVNMSSEVQENIFKVLKVKSSDILPY
ncbi:MAG: helix-turn-helix transcriptional regulator [Patescibacteria group bacterium]|nr:helix-turn-helix transcriptional regulator [Patescibacteria group bacterium]